MLLNILSRSAIVLASMAVHGVVGQLSTDCNPMQVTNCPHDPALGMDFNFVFNNTPDSSIWKNKVGGTTYSSTNGAAFTINKQKDAPTIETKFYFFWGRTEVWLKAASGKGVISSVVLSSDDLDEVDWEFMGGNVTHAETNYFGKGRQDFLNAIYYPVKGGVQADFHNYTNVWTKDQLEWWIDGQLVRTLTPKQANNTNNFPQTPMKLSMGIWAGGDPDLPKGTIEWAGGVTDYTKGPYTMYVKSAQVTDFSSGKEYIYGDKSGSWQSIQVVPGNSTVKETITAPPPQSLSDKWNNLSPVAKTAIYASAAAVGGLLFLYACWFCFKQRRRGKKEAELAAQRIKADAIEIEQFKKKGINPDSFTVTNSEYHAADMEKDGFADKQSYSVPSSPALGKSPQGGAASAWDADGAPRSPMPLLREGAQSPRVASPGPGAYSMTGGAAAAAVAAGYGPAAASPYGRDDRRSPTSALSPMRSASPGMPPQFPPPASPGPRSFTAPNAPMRNMSPGPQQQGYGAMPRMNSPGPLNLPNRSFSTGGPSPSGGYGGYSNDGGYGGPNNGRWGGNPGGTYR